MQNMNKKRWILVGVTMIAAAFVLIFFVYTGNAGQKGIQIETGGQQEGRVQTKEDARTGGDAQTDGASGGTLSQDVPDSVSETSRLSGSLGEETSGELVVYICGAVKKPGVYDCKTGERIADAIAKAGGLKKNASDLVNLAEPLEDGKRIYIPTKKEVADGTMDAAAGLESLPEAQSSDSGGTAVNINTADAATLMTLPGIGKTRADSILAYREEHGRFQSIEEIKNISGIKDGLFSKIQDLITVQ